MTIIQQNIQQNIPHLFTTLKLFFNNNVTTEVEKHPEMAKKDTNQQWGGIGLVLNQNLEK